MTMQSLRTEFVRIRLKLVHARGNVRGVKKKHDIRTEWILDRISDQGKLVSDIAVKMKLSQPSLSHRIHGNYPMTMNEAFRLAKILKCSVDDFEER